MKVPTSEADSTATGSHDRGRRRNIRAAAIVGSLCAVALVSAAVSGIVPVAPALAICALIPAALVDIRERRLPDVWVATALAGLVIVTMAAWATGEPPAIGPTIAGALLAAGPILALHLVSPESMGFGDVKVASVLGLALGSIDWRLALVALTLAAGSAGAYGIASRARTIAFGPFLVVGAVAALLFANTWLSSMTHPGTGS